MFMVFMSSKAAGNENIGPVALKVKVNRTITDPHALSGRGECLEFVFQTTDDTNLQSFPKNAVIYGTVTYDEFQLQK
jgi:hypothetical protein